MDYFTEGDFIEVTPKPDSNDFGVMRGTALSSGGKLGGLSEFRMQIAVNSRDKQVITLNSNRVYVKNLFRADHARSMDPGT